MSQKEQSGKGAEKARGRKDSGRLAITQVKSGICTPKDQKATLVSLGFRRRGEKVVREDSPAVRGMIRKVRHLVLVEAEAEAEAGKAKG